ncbi:DUF488 domain-containing protein [bacterium]|nr:MAG: DUF488 domain-containing protein [bacterium]
MTAPADNGPVQIWTVGHSTLGPEGFLELLRSHQIARLADVRRFPGSRRYPHFNEQPLRELLGTSGIAYHSFRDLGGRRTPRPDSQNTGWRNESFRGYADFMVTEEFLRGVSRLQELARTGRTAIMCAEALWWRCHRGLIADYLKASGLEVCHITGPGISTPHPFTRAARIVEGKLSYRGKE